MSFNIAIDGPAGAGKKHDRKTCVKRALDLFMSIPGQCIVRSQFI